MLLNAKIHDIKIIHPGLAIFQVAADDWQFPEFKANQYAILGLPCEAPRYIGALPEEKAHPVRLFAAPTLLLQLTEILAILSFI
jgi:hypothetical protein